jgi:hypothetical protein
MTVFQPRNRRDFQDQASCVCYYLSCCSICCFISHESHPPNLCPSRAGQPRCCSSSLWTVHQSHSLHDCVQCIGKFAPQPQPPPHSSCLSFSPLWGPLFPIDFIGIDESHSFPTFTILACMRLWNFVPGPQGAPGPPAMAPLLAWANVSSQECVHGYTGVACRDCVRPGYYRLGDLCAPCPKAAYGAIMGFVAAFGAWEVDRCRLKGTKTFAGSVSQRRHTHLFVDQRTHQMHCGCASQHCLGVAHGGGGGVGALTRGSQGDSLLSMSLIVRICDP